MGKYYVYAEHIMGDIYFSKTKLELDVCEQCGGCDDYIGCVSNKDEFMGLFNIHNEAGDYVYDEDDEDLRCFGYGLEYLEKVWKRWCEDEHCD